MFHDAGWTSIRILVVDDYEPWRHFVSAALQQQPELQVIGEALDGLEAVRKAQQLKPDLILLDIGLPTLNGIEVARRIRQVSPRSRILFVSENRSWDIVEEALRTGTSGYVVKSDAGSELMPAVSAVLRGKRFISASLAPHDLTDDPPQNVGIAHQAGFYSDDRFLLDDLTQFAGATLKAGNAAIVVATESHRNSLLPRLQAYGLDVGTAIEQGRYIALDAADMLSAIMLNDMPDSARFFKLLGNLIMITARTGNGEGARVAIFGECVHLLWAQGNVEATIQLEKLADQLARAHGIDILCGYSLGRVRGGMDGHIFQQICAEHSAVSSR